MLMMLSIKSSINSMDRKRSIHFLTLGFKILAAILVVAYPFIVYFGLKFWSIGLLAPVLIVIFCLRFMLIKGKLKELTWLVKIITLMVILILCLSWLLQKTQLLLFYPVMMNGLFLLFFACSLFYPPTIIERLARLQEPDLPEEGVIYTKKVTQIWCGFFLFNGSIATWTCLQNNLEIWTLYNGAISYVLMSVLFAGEWLVRKWLRTQ